MKLNSTDFSEVKKIVSNIFQVIFSHHFFTLSLDTKLSFFLLSFVGITKVQPFVYIETVGCS